MPRGWRRVPAAQPEIAEQNARASDEPAQSGAGRAAVDHCHQCRRGLMRYATFVHVLVVVALICGGNVAMMFFRKLSVRHRVGPLPWGDLPARPVPPVADDRRFGAEIAIAARAVAVARRADANVGARSEQCRWGDELASIAHEARPHQMGWRCTLRSWRDGLDAGAGDDGAHGATTGA